MKPGKKLKTETKEIPEDDDGWALSKILLEARRKRDGYVAEESRPIITIGQPEVPANPKPASETTGDLFGRRSRRDSQSDHGDDLPSHPERKTPPPQKSSSQKNSQDRVRAIHETRSGLSQEIRVKSTGHSSNAMNDRYRLDQRPLSEVIGKLPMIEDD